MTAELPRSIRLDRLGPAPVEHKITASASECRALAERFGIPAILSLTCTFRLRRLMNSVVVASGSLTARLVRTCVVTLEDFETEMTEEFALRFVPQGTESPEIDPDSEDEIPYAGDVIDLGDAAAEELALGLDPYPRQPGAELEMDRTGFPPHPFSGLESWRRHKTRSPCRRGNGGEVET